MKKWVKIILISGTLVLAFIVFGIAFYISNIITQEQVTLNLQKLGNFTNKITLYDTSNDIISTSNQLGNQTIELSKLSDYTKNAFIAIEDNDFYQHNGLNYRRMLKALFTNITSGYTKEGASTITQQLIKNTHLTNEKTLKRKIKEIVLALDLEKKYTKDEILETYLNVIYFGNNSYGIEQASQNYFGHSASALTLSESAILAGLIKSPLLYSPLENKANCQNRRDLVLKQMLKYNYINNDEYQTAKQEPIVTTQPKININKAFDYFVMHEVNQKLNISEKSIYSSGLHIYTTIDQNIQQDIYDSLYKNLGQNKDCSGIVVDCLTGSVLGCVSTLATPDINRCPASLIKPILCYGSAFEHSLMTPTSPILDEPIYFDEYHPQNVDQKYVGWTDARYSLSHSLNIPAIKTLEYVGIDKAKAFASKFGLEFTDNDNHLALALGSMQKGATLVDIANAYTIFANLGVQKPIHFVSKITDRNNKLIYQYKDTHKTICKDSTAFMINDILKDSAKTGTAKKLASLNIPIASKTGTNGAKDGTNIDAWNVAYNNKYCSCVWYGNVSGQNEYNLSKSQNGGTLATKTAVNLWSKLKQGNNFKDFVTPNSVQKIKINKQMLESSHKITLANQDTPERYIIYDYYPIQDIDKLKTTSVTINDNAPNLSASILDNDMIEITWDSIKDQKYALIVKSPKKIYTSKIIIADNTKTTLKLNNIPSNTEIYVQLDIIGNNIDTSDNLTLFVPKNASKKDSLAKKMSNIWLNKK